MRWSNVAQSTLGVLFGFAIVGMAVGLTSFLFLQQLSRSPAKPSFSAAQKDTSQLDIRAADDNTYPAVVVYPQDLLLRDKPDSKGKVIDKLRFEETVVVVGESDDKQWQHVRFETKGIDGWVGAGNLKRAQ